MSGTKILGCDCDNKFQDRRYGRKRRVHNNTVNGARCTGCGSEKK